MRTHAHTQTHTLSLSLSFMHACAGTHVYMHTISHLGVPIPQLFFFFIRNAKLYKNESEPACVGMIIIFFGDQVVFAGDSLKLRCRAPTVGTMVGERSIASVVWMWGSQDPAKVFEEIFVENHYLADSGLVERYVCAESFGSSECLVHSLYIPHREVRRTF